MAKDEAPKPHPELELLLVLGVLAAHPRGIALDRLAIALGCTLEAAMRRINRLDQRTSLVHAEGEYYGVDSRSVVAWLDDVGWPRWVR